MDSSSGETPRDEEDAARPTVRGIVANHLAPLVPHRIRQAAISVSITAPTEIQQGSSVQFTIQFRNRLPIPLELETGLRPWYWHIDGVHDADASEPDPDELGDETRVLSFSPFEVKTIQRSWNGRICHEPSGQFVLPGEGAHELGVLVVTKQFKTPTATHVFSVQQ